MLLRASFCQLSLIVKVHDFKYCKITRFLHRKTHITRLIFTLKHVFLWNTKRISTDDYHIYNRWRGKCLYIFLLSTENQNLILSWSGGLVKMGSRLLYQIWYFSYNSVDVTCSVDATCSSSPLPSSLLPSSPLYPKSLSQNPTSHSQV